MVKKPKPLTYMETHAGRGLYDLNCAEAKKTGEAKEGIGLELDNQKQPNDSYMRVVGATRQRFGCSFYPGSPWIARQILRSEDSVHLMERHPGEYPALKRLMGQTGAHIHHRDGYEGVLALAPPTPRRGLVLIDPSYEIKDEYTQVAQFIPALHRKWPEAVILLWYPLLAEGRHKAMIALLLEVGLPGTEIHETIFSTSGGSRGIRGSGLFLLNSPFGFTFDTVTTD